MRVKQVDHALNLLEIFACDRMPMTLTALAGRLEMPKSSVFNLIDTLVGRGLLYEVSARGGYYPTRRLLDLSSAIMEGDSLLRSIRGELQALARETNETVVLSTRDHADVVYLDVVEATAHIRYFAKVGERRPIHLASSGKAILITYDSAERTRILHGLNYTPRETAAAAEQALAAELDVATERGWCEDHGQIATDVLGFGTPIKLGDRRLGLALAGPIYRMRDHRMTLVDMLLATAERIRMIAGGG